MIVSGDWVYTMIFAGPNKSGTQRLNDMTWHVTLIEMLRHKEQK